MKCEESAKYCREWAKDYRHTDNLEMSGFWEAIALAFDGNVRVNGEGLDHAIRQLTIQLTEHDAMVTMIQDKKIRQAMNAIKREKEFVLPKLMALTMEWGDEDYTPGFEVSEKPEFDE